MRYVLDSTVVIDYANDHPPGIAVVDRLFSETAELFTCDVVTCEALSGGRPPELGAVRALLDALEYVAIDPHAARWAGDRRRERHAAGRKHSIADTLIAAVAWRLNATIVTRNPRDFAPLGVPVLEYDPQLP